MNKLFKYSAILAGIFVILLVGAAVALYAVVDTERIKSELAEQVRTRTGRELVFKGDVGLSVFPWLGVEMGPVSLSNAPGFGDAPFAEIRHADVKVKLMPLLSKDIRVKTLTLDGLTLNLARNKSGASNWDDLTSGGATSAAPAAAAETAPSGSAADAGLGLAGLAVGGVTISDANLSWSDAGTGQKANLSKLNLSTGPLALGSPFDFSLSTSAEAAEPPLKADLDLSAQADLSQDFKTPSLKGVIMKLTADGASLPGGHVDASMAGDIVIDLNKSSLAVQGLKLKTMDMELAGQVDVASFDTDPVVRAALQFKELNPKKIMAALNLPAVETTDPAALTQASGSLDATATTNSATIKRLDLKLDETTLSGSASVFNFAKPAIRFDLNADTLNVDRYLPPDAAGGGQQDDAPAQTAPAADDKAKTDSSGLPKDELRALDVDGSVKVGNLVLYNLKFSNMSLTLKAKDGVIRITPLSADLYGGSFKTGLMADMSGSTTKSSLDFDLSDLKLGNLLTDVMGEDKVTGLTNLSLSLTGAGEDWKSLAQTLNGSGKVALANGVFKGFQILPEAVRKKATETDPQGREVTVQKQQPFKDLSASFNVKNGVVSTGDTTLTADGLGATATGQTDLAKEQLNYQAVVNLPALPKIPVNVTGHWSDPKISLDTVAFLENTATGIIKLPVEVGKEAVEIGKGAGEAGKDLIQGIGQGIIGIIGGKKKSE